MESKESNTLWKCSKQDHRQNMEFVCINKECLSSPFLCLECVRQHSKDHTTLEISKFFNEMLMIMQISPILYQQEYLEALKQKEKQETADELFSRLETLIDRIFDEMIEKEKEKMNLSRKLCKQKLQKVVQNTKVLSDFYLSSSNRSRTVSYTHLTLPTIYSV
eukprot:TRINITY_DN5218_c0_g1_i1.p1 TRINITY_DN5218_c0_g1~~TRINITY_DN5218_c0_g1_i1.p1  ORF type:complete len:163 (-),score=37.13 TRINITY_DN5218_c0_g1_i1:34-522(-)